MKLPVQFHLDEEQINRAVIDEMDLAEQYRLHLAQCEICRKQVEQVKNELYLFGEHVRSSVPPMKKTVYLPAEAPVPAGHGSVWLPSFAVAVMTCLILFVYFLGVENKPLQMTAVQSPEVQPLELTIEDEALMDQIFQMVEYPLPDDVYGIIGDDGGDFDEFLEFVVPDDQDNFQS